ncbi:MAG: RNA polymerase sigma factor [Gemmatimonadota bacterium]|nr:MAG: RNA polymerase sigma factor [Gemmatimonadota bacterium]
MKTAQFKRVAQQYKDFIYSYAYYFTGTREDAEDLTQEMLLKIWENMDSLRLGLTKSWVTKVTRNLCIDWLRRRGARPETPPPLDSGERDPDLPAPFVESDVETEELRRNIKKAIAKLPEKSRSVIILREIEDLKYEEISEVLDMPINSVKSYIHRGRRLLRQHLSAIYENDY